MMYIKTQNHPLGNCEVQKNPSAPMPDESRNTKGVDSPEGPRDRGRPNERPGPGLSGVTAVVLAGGKSRRYGKNKALEQIDGVSLIERTVATLERVFHRVILSANDPEPYAFLHLPVIKDLYPGVGQLGGVHAGLCAMSDDAGFFVACDMPFLNPDLIRHMALLSSGRDAVVPRIGPHVEPLHALYKKTCIAPMVRAIERNERRIVSFYPEISIRYVEEEEIRVFDPGLDAFINVNRPQELRLSIDRMKRRTGPGSGTRAANPFCPDPATTRKPQKR